MKKNLGPEFFKENRRKLRESFGGTAPIVITSNGLVQRTRDDDTYDFQQDSNFWYLTGLDEPNLILVIDRDKDFLIGPLTNESWRIFHGDADFERFSKDSGIEEVLPNESGWQKLSKRLKKSRHAATIIPPKLFDDRFLVYTNPAKRRLVQMMRRYNTEIKFIDINSHIAALRTVKTPGEIQAIEGAIDESLEVLKVIGKKIGKYKNERELSAEMDYLYAKRGLKASFRQIVAGGKNAVTLHYTENNAPINPKDILLIDMGVIKNGYCSDLTRSISLNPTKRQLEVYEATRQVQLFAMKMLRPGLQLASYEAAVEHYMGEKLRELGLIRTIDSESVRKYYPHNTSHFLGIDVHDVGDFTKPLPENAVLTVEPGIYIPEEDIGIRIEDDVVLTREGNRLLSGRLSRELTSLTIK